MKKLLSVLLCALLCISTCVPAFADNGDEVAELILQVKNKFGISDDVFVFENYSKDDYNGDVTYNLRWKSKTEDYTYQPYISVRIESDGDIQHYRLGGNSSKTISLPKFTDEEVLARAGELVKEIAPNRAENIAEGKVEYYVEYEVNFERTENDIPVAGDYISLRLDPDTLDVIYYNANWTDIDFPAPENIIDYNTAKDTYKSDIGYQLMYNINTEKGEIDTIYLSYAPFDTNAYIDAFTGTAIKYNGTTYRFAGSSSGAMNDMAEKESVSLSPEEQTLVDEINKMITKDEAEKIARGIKEFNIKSDAQITSYGVHKNRYGKYTASLSFNKNEKNNYYYSHITIDVESKKPLSFSTSVKNDSTIKVDETKAKEKAEGFLNKYYSEYLEEMKPERIIGESDKYSFVYNRYINDVRVKNNDMYVVINQHTGEISEFGLTYAETDFPSAENAVDPEEIYSKVLTDDNFRLQYMPSVEYVYDEKTGKETQNAECFLGYIPCDFPVYGGETAMEIDYRGLPAEQEFTAYTDTKDHYCRSAAESLAKIGIYFEGDALMPDTEVSQPQYLKLLLNAVYQLNYVREEDILRSAISQGIITKEEVGLPLTRIAAVKYFINAIGFKEAAEIQGIYNCPFTDVADNMKGYAALAGGIGIVNNTVSVFRSDAIVTRGEVLTMIHNYLSK